MDVGEDVGGGLVLGFDLLGGVFGGEVVVFAQFAGGDGPGVVAGGAGLIQLEEFGQVGVGDGLVFGELLRGLALVVRSCSSMSRMLTVRVLARKRAEL